MPISDYLYLLSLLRYPDSKDCGEAFDVPRLFLRYGLLHSHCSDSQATAATAKLLQQELIHCSES
jgi:hypothetical protein